jgi:hypothetical protein
MKSTPPTLTFSRDRKVYWGDTLAGRIEPVISGAGKWAFVPEASADVPTMLWTRTTWPLLRDVKSFLRSLIRIELRERINTARSAIEDGGWRLPRRV